MAKILIRNDVKSTINNDKQEENLYVNIKQLGLNKKSQRKLEALINIFNIANVIGYSQIDIATPAEDVFSNLLKSKFHIANVKLRHCKILQNQQDFMLNLFGEDWSDIPIVREYLKIGDYLAYSSMSIELLYFNLIPSIHKILDTVGDQKEHQNNLRKIKYFIETEQEKIEFSILSRMKNTVLTQNITNDDVLFSVNHALCELSEHYFNWYTECQSKSPYHKNPLYGIKRNTWLNFHHALLSSHHVGIKEEYTKLWEKVTTKEQLIPFQVVVSQDTTIVVPIIEGIEKDFIQAGRNFGLFEIGKRIRIQYFTKNFYEFNEINCSFNRLKQKIDEIQAFPSTERISAILCEFNVFEKIIHDAKLTAQKSKVHGVIGKLFFRKTNLLLDVWINKLDAIKTQRLSLLKNALMQKITNNLPEALWSVGYKLLQEESANLDVFFEGIFNFVVNLDNQAYDQKIVAFIDGINENIKSPYFLKLKNMVQRKDAVSSLNKLRRLQRFNEDSLDVFQLGFLEQLYIDNEFSVLIAELPIAEVRKLLGKFQMLSGKLPSFNPMYSVFQVLAKLSEVVINSEPVNFLLAEHGKLIDCFQLFQKFNNYLNQILTSSDGNLVQFNQKYLSIFRTDYFNQDLLPFWRQWAERLVVHNKFTLLPLELRRGLTDKLGEIDLRNNVEDIPKSQLLVESNSLDGLTDRYAGDFIGSDEMGDIWKHIIYFDALKIANNFNLEQQNSFYYFCKKFSERWAKSNALSGVNGYMQPALSTVLQQDLSNNMALFMGMDPYNKDSRTGYYKTVFKLHRFYLIGKLYCYKEENDSVCFFKDKNAGKIFSTILDALDNHYYRIQGSETEYDIFRLINKCWLDIQNNIFLTKQGKKVVAEFYKDFGIHEFLDSFSKKSNCISNFAVERKSI